MVPNFYRLIEVLTERIGTELIVCNCQVTEIVQKRNVIRIKTSNFSSFEAFVVIVATPWQCIQNGIIFMPDIPKELIVPIPMHQQFVTSFTAQYSVAKPWRQHSLSGSYFLRNAICYPTSSNTIYGRIYHENNRFDTVDANKVLAEQFAFRWSEQPVRWQCMTWEQAPLLGLPPTTAWQHVIWASSNASNWYRGFANGAVQSGLRAGILALLDLRPQTVEWQDFNDIEHAHRIPRFVCPFSIFFASINLYNAVWYGLGWPIVVYLLWRNRYRATPVWLRIEQNVLPHLRPAWLTVREVFSYEYARSMYEWVLP